jgi:sugar (pentulose or hexulose) kinase
MKYYIWLDKQGRPLSRAWRYDDETERMAAEQHPPASGAVLRAGTRQQLMERFGLHDKDFAD